jgi:hypothetical protein
MAWKLVGLEPIEPRRLTRDSQTMTQAMLVVIHALDPLARDERQRVLLAVTDLLALDRQENAP